MKPLIVLLAAFLLTLLATRLFDNEWQIVFAGNLALSAMLLFTAMGHFVFTKGMTMMMPNFLPFKKGLVYLTGLLEIVAAIGLLLPAYRLPTAVGLVIFFILILPANIIAAGKKVDYQKANYTGSGLPYLWFRVPLQLLFIAWVLFFGIWL